MTSSQRFPRVPISWGELIDKITILEIKAERLHDPAAAANARAELSLLQNVLAGPPVPPAEVEALRAALGVVNRRLWDIENASRRKEATQSFDGVFVELARAVYHTNDERNRIRRQIDELLGSGIVEEKQYDPY
jgi:hypothetical protein